jgi:hypothetical protein
MDSLLAAKTNDFDWLSEDQMQETDRLNNTPKASDLKS